MTLSVSIEGTLTSKTSDISLDAFVDNVEEKGWLTGGSSFHNKEDNTLRINHSFYNDDYQTNVTKKDFEQFLDDYNYIFDGIVTEFEDTEE